MSDYIKLINEFVIDKNIIVDNLNVKDVAAYNIMPKDLQIFLNFLKESKDLRFTILTDLFGCDFLARRKRFEIVYNLLSLKLNKRLIVKINTSENEPVPSVVNIFSAAKWYEREAYDMYGVVFAGNNDLRRILTDYTFEGHPLRKDFLLTGYTQVKYDDKLQKVVYEPVDLELEYRNFDFSSPWQGPTYVLPGDEKALNFIPKHESSKNNKK